MVTFSVQTYNSTREDTTVIHQTYYWDEWYALSWAVKESRTLLSAEKKRKVLHYLWKLLRVWLLIFLTLLQVHFLDVGIISHANVGRVVTLAYNSYIWRTICLFNSLPMHLRSMSSCSVLIFKTQLDIFLGSVEDLPCLPGFNNSLDGGDCRWWSPRDGLATN